MKHQLVCSMSTKCNGYDTACTDGFLHTMKVEAIHGERFATHEEMGHTVFKYIEFDDNRTCRHSGNSRLSLIDFEDIKAA